MTNIPSGYQSLLDLYETQEGIALIKHTFVDFLCKALNLKRVSAPLFVEGTTGLNDDLNGIERPVRFDVKQTGADVEVVHSLAKWKRQALKRYGFPVGEGLYTDMNAIRRDEALDNLHSIYVDQWDWEKVITKEQRTMATLKDAMQRIVTAICTTADLLQWRFPELSVPLTREVTFFTAQELEDLYPSLTPKQRENKAAELYGSVGLLQIGGALRSGKPHDGRAPDYDDWSLNGDILFWLPALHCALEISSMGIRVDEKSIVSQCKTANCEGRLVLPYHQMIQKKQLPYTIGGGIGQSRLCMLLLNKAHIGEVQASVWPDQMIADCEKHNIHLL